MKRGQFPWYACVLAASLVLAAFADADISIAALWRPLAMVISATLAFQAVLTLVLRSSDRAAAITATTLIAAHLPRLAPFFVAAVVVLAAAGMMHARAQKASASASIRRLANPFSLLLLAAVVAVGAAQGGVAGLVADTSRSEELVPAVPEAVPNVHVILVDGYPRADTLERLFDYDNGPFLSQLDRRGFEVASHSRSNYMWTELTLASMLQMRHIEPHEARESGRRLIVNNPAFALLRQKGYRISANAAVYEGITLRSADRLCGDGDLTDFEYMLIDSTIASPILRIVHRDLLGERHRRFAEAAFECMEGTDTTVGAHLVYTHIPIPHLPIVFQRDGSPSSLPAAYASDQYDPETFAPAYVQQVQYVNRRLLDAIDRVIDDDDTAVVIIMSDHGSESELDWDDPSESDHAERFSTLFAARTPGLSCVFGDAPTPVNLFPTLFNTYFDAKLPSQPDATYISDSATKLTLEEVPNPDAGAGSC